MSAEPPPVDPTVVQIQVARDPELMREVLQKHLRPLGEETYRIRECRISRAHYVLAARRTFRYSLHLEEVGTGRERTESLTGVMYAEGGRARREWEGLRRAKPGREVSSTPPTFEPFFFIPELEMLVQVFPYDPQLPGLPVLMAGPQPELEPLVLARFGQGDWRTEAWDMEPVRYRIGKRMTSRLRVRARDRASGRLGERRFYAKVYLERAAGERTYEVARRMWEKAQGGGEGFTVGRPVAYLSDLRILIQEEVPGSSLYDVILREEEVAPAARSVARSLAALHLDEDLPSPPRPRPSKEDSSRRLKNIEKVLRRACPHLGAEIEEIISVVNAGLEAKTPTAPAHGDLHLRHILLHGGSPALIDLDAFAEADPLQDVALVLSEIAAMPLDRLLPRARARKVSQAFVDEYFAHVPESWRIGLPFHYARAVLKRAAKVHKRQSQAQGSSEKVEALVREAKGSLAGPLGKGAKRPGQDPQRRLGGGQIGRESPGIGGVPRYGDSSWPVR